MQPSGRGWTTPIWEMSAKEIFEQNRVEDIATAGEKRVS